MEPTDQAPSRVDSPKPFTPSKGSSKSSSSSGSLGSLGLGLGGEGGSGAISPINVKSLKVQGSGKARSVSTESFASVDSSNSFYMSQQTKSEEKEDPPSFAIFRSYLSLTSSIVEASSADASSSSSSSSIDLSCGIGWEQKAELKLEIERLLKDNSSRHTIDDEQANEKTKYLDLFSFPEIKDGRDDLNSHTRAKLDPNLVLLMKRNMRWSKKVDHLVSSHVNSSIVNLMIL